MNTGLRPLALASAIVLSTGLAACGGSGGGNLLSSPGEHSPSPEGFLYITAAATNGSPGSVFQYSIGADGSVTPQSVSSVSAGTNPMGVAADPSGRYVYAVNGDDHTISQYAVGADGGLKALSPAVVSVPLSPSQGGGFWVSIDPSGHYLYVVTSPLGPTFVAAPASIAEYSIGGGGLLSPLTPASLTLSTLAAGPLVIDSIGRHAYLGGGASGVVLQFSIGFDGTLSALALAGVAADDPTGVVLAPRDEAGYVLGTCVDSPCNGQVSLYLIAPDSSLNPRVSTTVTGSLILPVDMVLNGSGSNAYLLSDFVGVDTNSGRLYQYAIDGSGTLVLQGELDTGSAAVAEALNGSHLYVLTSDARAAPPNGSGGHLTHFTVGAGGLPSELGTTRITGQNPTAMALVIAP